MHFAGTIGVVGGIAPCRLSGSLDATAVAGTATSATVTVTVPVGNGGQIRINFVDVGTVSSARYSKNGSAFALFSDGDTFTFANADTLALSTVGDNAGESRTYTLTDVQTGRIISTAVHTGA